MRESIILSSKHNYAALIDLCRGIHKKGYWTHDEPIESSVATTVALLFQSIAWSDRSLHRSECRVLDALMQEDEALGGSLAQSFIQLTNSEVEPEMPAFLQSAIRMDWETGTHVAKILINQLDSLAMLIAHSDDRIDRLEIERIASYRAMVLKEIAA